VADVLRVRVCEDARRAVWVPATVVVLAASANGGDDAQVIHRSLEEGLRGAKTSGRLVFMLHRPPRENDGIAREGDWAFRRDPYAPALFHERALRGLPGTPSLRWRITVCDCIPRSCRLRATSCESR
jgi:hypothetical protein